jgi:hypothetical protein
MECWRLPNEWVVYTAVTLLYLSSAEDAIGLGGFEGEFRETGRPVGTAEVSPLAQRNRPASNPAANANTSASSTTNDQRIMAVLGTRTSSRRGPLTETGLVDLAAAESRIEGAWMLMAATIAGSVRLSGVAALPIVLKSGAGATGPSVETDDFVARARSVPFTDTGSI